MHRYLSLLLFIYLAFGQSSNQKTTRYYDKNKLSIIEYSKFNWRLFRKVNGWYPTIGGKKKISAKEFFIITNSNEGQRLISQNEKIIIKNMTMATVSSVTGGVLILTPATGKWGVYLGLGPMIISQWLMFKAHRITAEPIMPYDSAKNIADKYNENLRLKIKG